MIWLTKVSVVREDLAPAEEYIPLQDRHLKFAETCEQAGLCGLREARQAVEAAMDRLIALCDMCALNQAAIKDLPAIVDKWACSNCGAQLCYHENCRNCSTCPQCGYEEPSPVNE